MSDYHNRKHLSTQAAGWCFLAIGLMVAGAVAVVLWRWL